MTERLRINLLFVILCFTWGSTWIAIKYGLGGLPPSTGASIRFALSALVLFALAWYLRMP